MKTIGISTACFPGIPMAQALQNRLHLRETVGVNALEVGLYTDLRLANYPSLSWPWEADELWQITKETISQFDLAGAHFTFQDINLISANPEIRKLSMEILQKSIRRSGELGFHYGVIHLKGECYGLPENEQLRLFALALQDLLETAGNYNMILCLENARLNSPSLVKLDALVQLVRFVNRSSLCILIDIGHAHLHRVDENGMISDLYGSYGSLERFLEREANLVYAFHVHTNDGISDLHQPISHCSNGAQYFRQLLKSDINRPFIMEAKFNDMAMAVKEYEWLDGYSNRDLCKE
jgi:endonuclease IV